MLATYRLMSSARSRNAAFIRELHFSFRGQGINLCQGSHLLLVFFVFQCVLLPQLSLLPRQNQQVRFAPSSAHIHHKQDRLS